MKTSDTQTRDTQLRNANKWNANIDMLICEKQRCKT